jgi:hypothetical protein
MFILPMAAGISVGQAATGDDAGQSDQSAAAGTGIWNMKRWSPYWVGIGIGLLSWIAFVLSDKPIGVSTAYAQTSGMIGIYLLRIPGLARLHTWSGSFGSTVIGGLIFGIGFAVLGYCPGTLAGAAGQGSLDALIGGVPGMLVGAGIYAAIYPKLAGSVLKLGEFDQETIPQVLGVKPWPVIAVVTLLILAIFAVIEVTGSLS